MNLNDWATLLGFGIAAVGLTLSILNYLRDRIKLKVTLQWDMTVTENPVYDSSKKYGAVKITNAGRRSTYVGVVALMLPKGATNRTLILSDSLKGEKLDEGSAPRSVLVDQEGFEKYAQYWDQIYAEVSDSAGKDWKSKPALKALGPPSWAKEK